MKNWNSLDAMFRAINSEVNYLVLRNFEELENSGFLDGHADIDFLCDDAACMAKVLGAGHRGAESDRTHCKVNIAGRIIPVDIREVGDGYYDAQWEKDMLAERQMYHGLFYILSEEQYFYSLIYHACIQKPCLSEEYKKRLQKMGRKIGIPMDNGDFIEKLQIYMREKGYKFTYPVHPGMTVNFRLVDKRMIEKNYRRIFERKVYACKKKLRSVLR